MLILTALALLLVAPGLLGADKTKGPKVTDKTTTVTLADLMSQKGQVPYTKSIKVKVIARGTEFTYKNEKNEDRVLLNCALADEATPIICTIYDNTKFARFMEGSSVILRNFIKKVDSIAVTTTTKVFPCNDVNVPQDISNRAHILLNPPPAPTKPVSEALNSPPRVRVSIKGRIMQEEATREVFVTEERVKVKNIYVEDSTSKCKVALWRNFAEKDIRPGDYVQITDVVTNTFRNEVSLTTTTKSKITKTDCPAEIKIYQAISGCLDGEGVTFLLQDDSILTIPYELVELALPEVKKNDVESHILEKCQPTISLRCMSKGSEFTSVEIM